MNWLFERRRFVYVWESGYIASLLFKQPGLHGADLGCQDGYGTKMLGPSFQGWDKEPKTHKVRHFDVEKNNWERLYHPEGAMIKHGIGVIVANHLIEHLEKPQTFIDNAYDSLEPGGTFFCATPNRNLRLKLGEQPWNPEHIEEYDLSDLLKLIGHQWNHVTIYGLYGSAAMVAWERRRIGAGGLVRGLNRQYPWLFEPLRPIWRLLFSPKQDQTPFTMSNVLNTDGEPLDLVAVCHK